MVDRKRSVNIPVVHLIYSVFIKISLSSNDQLDAFWFLIMVTDGNLTVHRLKLLCISFFIFKKKSEERIFNKQNNWHYWYHCHLWIPDFPD